MNRFFLYLALALLLFSCTDPKPDGPSPTPSPQPVNPTPTTVAVTGVSLSKTTLSLTEGDKETLTATVSPSNATNKTVNWTTSNASVATVSNGTVSAVKAGTATITVTTQDGGKTATCAVTVVAKHVDVQSVSVTDPSGKAESTQAPETTLQLTAKVSPDNASDKTVTWRSSNEAVAKVDGSGLVSILAEGSVVITAAAGGKEGTYTLTVKIYGNENFNEGGTVKWN